MFSRLQSYLIFGVQQNARTTNNFLSWSALSLSPDGTQLSYSGADEGLQTIGPSDLLSEPSNLQVSVHSEPSADLVWTDNSTQETTFHIERCISHYLSTCDDLDDWLEVGTVATNTTTYTNNFTPTCTSEFRFRVRAFRNDIGLFSGYSNIALANLTNWQPMSLALYKDGEGTTEFALTSRLSDIPDSEAYTQPNHEQWIMGDWDGDGQDTFGWFDNGAFFYTNELTSNVSNWTGIWLGPTAGNLVAGHFTNVPHDCIGLVVDNVGLWWTCEMAVNPPPMSGQWLGGQLADKPGEYQFAVGDFDGDGLDTVAIRRDKYIVWTNVPTTTEQALFPDAQYIGEPSTPGYGIFVSGDWDTDGIDSFGLHYPGTTPSIFYWRNDLEWNSGIYVTQDLSYFAGYTQATTWCDNTP